MCVENSDGPLAAVARGGRYDMILCLLEHTNQRPDQHASGYAENCEMATGILKPFAT